MGLNLGGGGGDFTPHIRYEASTSSWSMSSPDGKVPCAMQTAIFDLENIGTGWGKIAEGCAPEWVMDISLTQPVQKPDGEGWKRGFKLMVFSAQTFGDMQPAREYATTGTGANMGTEALYGQYEAEAPANVGKVPVVEFSGGVPKKVGKGNTTVPTLKIVKWVDRPADFEVVNLFAGSAVPVAANSPAPEQAAPVAASGGSSEF